MDAFRSSRRSNGGSRPEQGVAMLGLLLTVIILGVMVVIMLKTLGGSPSATGATTTVPSSSATPGTTATAPVTPENGAQEAAVAACQANFLAIETALTDYRSLNGSSPAAGAAWATATANGGPYFQAWPESATYYSITWNGAQLSVIPVRGAPSHGSDGTSSPKTGCFAA